MTEGQHIAIHLLTMLNISLMFKMFVIKLHYGALSFWKPRTAIEETILPKPSVRTAHVPLRGSESESDAHSDGCELVKLTCGNCLKISVYLLWSFSQTFLFFFIFIWFLFLTSGEIQISILLQATVSPKVKFYLNEFVWGHYFISTLTDW